MADVKERDEPLRTEYSGVSVSGMDAGAEDLHSLRALTLNVEKEMSLGGERSAFVLGLNSITLNICSLNI